MNILNTNVRSFQSAQQNAQNQPARRERRERDFGVGYGNSSGYASSKRYTSDWGLTRFRCA